MFLIAFAAFGAVVASFTGVLAERAYTGEGWAASRSRCNSCARSLDARDLVPVLSWIFSRGRCRSCKSPVPWLYAASEAALGLSFALAYLRFGLSFALASFLLALAILAFIVLYDLRHTLVPPLASSLLILASLAHAGLAAASPAALGASLLAAGAIGLGFFFLHAFSRGRAMGLGDAPVALALALLAGGSAVPGLLFSFWIGAAVGVVILVRVPKGARMGIEVPFVPFLAAGYLLAIFTQWNPLALPF
jgi:prepilin signal peptidase PulO-like enzyme (type II secretory pathway)